MYNILYFLILFLYAFIVHSKNILFTETMSQMFNTLWANTSNTNLKTVQRYQNRCFKALLFQLYWKTIIEVKGTNLYKLVFQILYM